MEYQEYKEDKKETENFVKAILLWKTYCDEYHKGNILVSIEMRLAQRNLINTSVFWLLWALSNIIIFPIITAILAVVEFGLGYGILFTIAFVLIYFYIYGRAAIDLDGTFNILMWLTGIVIVISIFSEQLIGSLSWALIFCWLCYVYYNRIGRTIINKYVLKDFDSFIVLVNNNVIHLKTKDGEIII